MNTHKIKCFTIIHSNDFAEGWNISDNKKKVDKL